MINLKNIYKEYQVGGNCNLILKEITFNVKRGEFVLITGKSGSGKSTLLNMLTGVDTPSSGEIVISGSDIQNLNESQMADWRGKNIGIIFQFFQLIPTLSVLENILLPMDLVNIIPAKDRMSKALHLLKLVGMQSHYNKMPSTLSGGEQQRVAIARALANDASLIIADEPTGNLDSKNADSIFELLCKLKKQGKTIVMVTHEREVMKGVTRKIVMKDGEIIEDLCLKRGEKIS